MFKHKSRAPAFHADFSGSYRTPTAFKAVRLAVDELGLSGDITALAVDPVGGYWAIGASSWPNLTASNMSARKESPFPSLHYSRDGRTKETSARSWRSRGHSPPLTLFLCDARPLRQVSRLARSMLSALDQCTSICRSSSTRQRRGRRPRRARSSTSPSTRPGAGWSPSTPAARLTSGASGRSTRRPACLGRRRPTRSTVR
jgi:hypothetical protein